MDSKPAPNGWARHWKWLVPAGCLTGVAGLAKAQRDPVVISLLGPAL